jgi:hypothetical protein
VTEQYTINLLSTIAFYGRQAFKKMSFTLHRLISKTFSIPSSLLSVADKNTCLRQTTATIKEGKEIPIHTSTGVRPWPV